jgi:hypothetical protein
MKGKLQRFKLGRYTLGGQDVYLYWRHGSGAEFYGGPGEIVLGVSQKDWPDCVQGLLHEAIEMSASVMGLRWGPTPDYSNSVANYLFVLTHEELAEVIGRAAWFVVDCLPALERVWKKQRRQKQ